MSRNGFGLAGLGVAIGLACALGGTAAHAADTTYEVFRPSYDVHWQDEYEDSLSFELGLRYWYTNGELTIGGYEGTDTSQSGEVHFRIDDWSTSTYAKGHIGYGSVIDGENNVSGDYSLGRMAYGQADLGYNVFATEEATLSGFVGYAYSNQENRDAGLDVHALRLGVSGRASLSDMFDINAEIAAIPYAWAHAYGNDEEGDGSLYGYSGEVMVGITPAPNFVVRGGVRAEYLTGPITFDDEERDTEYFRWGPLIELTYAF